MEISEVWPEVWGRGEIQTETRDVDRAVGEEVEHGGELSYLIQTPWMVAALLYKDPASRWWFGYL